MDHEPPATAPTPIRPRPPGGWTLGDCPECLTRYTPVHPRQLFCCEAHRLAWNDRWRVRGRSLGLLYLAARQTRGGSRGDTATGKRARRDAEIIAQQLTNKDTAKNRMPAIDFVRLRYRLGYERP